VTEWEPGEAPAPATGKALLVLWFTALVAPWVALAAVGNGLFRVACLVVIALQAAWALGQRRLLLAGTVPALADEHPRLANLASGLAGDLGMSAPRLRVSPKAGANAFVVPGVLVVTTDLLSSYTRTELEAVVAHCLVRLRAGGLGWAVGAAATGLRTAAPRVDAGVDARAAAVTRYPPALASAIRKASPARGRAAPLWFVADAASHSPAEERAGALLDL
jgi:hypothetical protein